MSRVLRADAAAGPPVSPRWGVCSSHGLATLTWSVIGVLMLSVLADLTLLERPRPGVATVSLLAAVAVLPLALRHRRKRLTALAVERAVGACLVLLVVVAGVHTALTPDGSLNGILVLALAATGSLLPRFTWLLACDVVAALCLSARAAVASAPEPVVRLFVLLLFSVVAAHVLYLVSRQGRVQVQALTAALERQARHDDLTGVLNRRGARTPCPR